MLDQVPAFYKPYLEQLDLGQDPSVLLENTGMQLEELITNISEDKSLYRYAEGKWSIKDVIQHLIDSERIFANRMLRFARADDTDLPGFEQNDYVDRADADSRPLADLVDEFRIVRKSTLQLYKSFGKKMLNSIGTANGYPQSTNMIALIVAGHTVHHCNIIENRYLK